MTRFISELMHSHSYDLVIFDLDDTLYPEVEYLKQAYSKIGKFIELEYGHDGKKIEQWLLDQFLDYGRKGLFQNLIKEFELREDNRALIPKFLALMRSVSFSPKIELNPSVKNFLKQCMQATSVVVITNGNPKQQQNKINHISWEGLPKKPMCFFANEFAPKPSPKVYEQVTEQLQLKSNHLKVLMVGDSRVDELFATNIEAEFLPVSEIKM